MKDVHKKLYVLSRRLRWVAVVVVVGFLITFLAVSAVFYRDVLAKSETNVEQVIEKVLAERVAESFGYKDFVKMAAEGRVLEAEKILLRGRDGKVYIELDAGANSLQPSIILRDLDGAKRVEIRVLHNREAMVKLFKGDGTEEEILELNSGEMEEMESPEE